MAEFSRTFDFASWPNVDIPPIAAGVYAFWQEDRLIYCGMSGQDVEKVGRQGKKKYGLVVRLGSHASGRLSGDQFCVYVANKLVVPSLEKDDLSKFARGEYTLDRLTKCYIHEHLSYQYAVVDSGREARDLEKKAREGKVFGVKPLLNPL